MVNDGERQTVTIIVIMGCEKDTKKFWTAYNYSIYRHVSTKSSSVPRNNDRFPFT